MRTAGRRVWLGEVMSRALRSVLWALAFVLALSAPALAQNLVPDPSFSLGVPSGWDVPYYHNVVWVPTPGAGGQPGFARFVAFGPGTAAASICLPATAGINYKFGAKVRVIEPDVLPFVEVVFFSSAGCQDLDFLSFQDGPELSFGAPLNAWHQLNESSSTAPPGTVSVQLRMRVTVISNTPQIDFDDIYLTQPGLLQEVPTLSEASLAAFGALLGIAALILLRRR
jgi:hypothetical protein